MACIVVALWFGTWLVYLVAYWHLDKVFSLLALVLVSPFGSCTRSFFGLKDPDHMVLILSGSSKNNAFPKGECYITNLHHLSPLVFLLCRFEEEEKRR
jgi:hypothetical protein